MNKFLVLCLFACVALSLGWPSQFNDPANIMQQRRMGFTPAQRMQHHQQLMRQSQMQQQYAQRDQERAQAEVDLEEQDAQLAEEEIAAEEAIAAAVEQKHEQESIAAAKKIEAAAAAKSEAKSESTEVLFVANQAEPQKVEVKFEFAKPDAKHVDLSTVREESVKTLNARKQGQQQGRTKRPNNKNGKQNGNGNNDGNKPGNKIDKAAVNAIEGLGGLGGLGFNRFQSLIIIANSNSNSNLGVALIDVDILRSFLSQFFLGKKVDDVLKDSDLDDLVTEFNGQQKAAKTENTQALKANIKTYSNPSAKKEEVKDGSTSSSESTMLLSKTKHESEAAAPAVTKAGEGIKNLQFGMPAMAPFTYNYAPYQEGGVIVINNVNDNLNDRIRSVLGGEGINTGNPSAGLVLPLDKAEIDRLMNDAIIVNNDNRNANKY